MDKGFLVPLQFTVYVLSRLLFINCCEDRRAEPAILRLVLAAELLQLNVREEQLPLLALARNCAFSRTY